ncbi:MAG: DNA alkylation repair protein [Muribaculaceae bacterium]|nr:DNA alkylation repair protein [Muribaculaceae bacterium]
MVKNWQAQLRAVAKPEKIKILSSFFKTGKGEYGEGDQFIGLTVPENRKIAIQYHEAPFSEIEKMLRHEIHEFRLSGFLALVAKFKKCKCDNLRQAIVDFYVTRGTMANNWDLVDLSAPYILGVHLINSPNPTLLDRLSHSDNLWLQRIAIVATLSLIRANRFDDTLRLAERYLSHPHPLIHKATGWMLREIGKRDEATLRDFLETNAHTMPRTALSYAIERLSATDKAYYRSL